MSNSRQKGTKLGTCSPDQVYQVLQTSPQGLNSQEVKKRQATYGPNQLKESKKEPIWLTFFRHFTSLMALLLWVGGFIAMLSHSLELGIAIWLVDVYKRQASSCCLTVETTGVKVMLTQR